jgi:hypothetical protein
MPILANQTASFIRTDPAQAEQETAAVPVHILPAMEDAKLYEWAAAFRWKVCWDPWLSFGDGTPVSSSDQIRWVDPDCTAVERQQGGRRFVLRHANYTFGVLAQGTAYFEEVTR